MSEIEGAEAAEAAREQQGQIGWPSDQKMSSKTNVSERNQYNPTHLRLEERNTTSTC